MISTGGTTLLLMGLASSVLCSTASADLVDGQIEFSLEFEDYPGYELPWSAIFAVQGFYDDGDGSFEVPTGSGSIDLVVGDFSGTQQHQWLSIYANPKAKKGDAVFEAEFVIYDMPFGLSDQQIELSGGVAWQPAGNRWSGEFEGTASPYTPFGAGGSPLSGTWSAQIVPAPGAIALLGLGGLARRRRRD